MDMDKLEQEETAATVFSYLIRGLSNGNRPAVKAELMEKMKPIKELYACRTKYTRSTWTCASRRAVSSRYRTPWKPSAKRWSRTTSNGKTSAL